MRIVVKPLGLVLLLAIVAGLVILPRLQMGPNKAPSSTSVSPVHLQESADGTSANNLLAGKTWKFWTENGAVGQYTPLPPGQDGHTEAWRFTIETPGRQIFHAGFNAPLLDVRLNAGEKVTLRFAARSTESVLSCVVLQRNTPPFSPSDKQWLKLTPEWKNYDVTLTSDNYGPGEAVIALLFGEKKGTLEIADPVLVRQ